MLGMLIDSQCEYCTHLDRTRLYTDGHYCSAYPDGIPDEIILNAVEHNTAYVNDKGIQFEQDPNEEAFIFDTPRSVRVY